MRPSLMPKRPRKAAESDDEPAGDGENAGGSEDDQTEDEVESAADSDNE